MAIDKTLERLWRTHQALAATGQADAPAWLVEIAVEHAHLAGLADAAYGEGAPVPDVRTEAAKILGTLREAERYGRDARFSEESFKALLRLVYKKGRRAVENRCDTGP